MGPLIMQEPWTTEKLTAALRQHFGHAAFREGQLETIRQVLAGDDVVLVMPTGSGKSLCYQLTAVLMPGVTIVVSPLIALMKDQVDGLESKGIAATFINSSLTAGEMMQRLNSVRSGRFKLVYVAPERFRNQRFREALQACELSLLTIDEAHCISQWGHDFRPDYLNLKSVAGEFPAARILAVTATATPAVRDDITVQLGMDGIVRPAPAVIVTGFARPNLYLKVSRCATHKQKLARLNAVVKEYGCGIVYCATRKMVERVASMLAESGVKALIYHGAMTDSNRSEAQNRFMTEPSPVVVATNAFGMGVDRGDLNFVVHWDIPGSLEAYYQEVGRAGRQGQPAWCELLFNYADVRTQQFFLDGANPSESDIHQLWQAIQRSCMAQGEVTCTQQEWAGQADIKNTMSVGSVMAMMERAGLIEREIQPGNRSFTVRLTPDADFAGLAHQLQGMEKKRERDQHKLTLLLRFVDSMSCRHAFVLDYFGERIERGGCGGCDRCGEPGSQSSAKPPTEEQWIVVQKALSCVARMGGRFGARRVAAVLRGEKDEAIERHQLHELSTYALLADWQVKDLMALLAMLQGAGCLEQTADLYRMISLTSKGREVMYRRVDIKLCWPAETTGGGRPRAGGKAARQGSAPAAAQLTAGGEALCEQLRDWTRGKAAALGVPAFHVLNRKTIEAIAAARPEDFSALQEVKGMGPVKVQRFGRAILDIVAKHN
ncbi:MAG: ATP-dependent DNA helicase [Kiritimatiellae bacterium]|nr:ATP-dependent DNA helicase [Kiritimatiellia bacterium]